MIANLLPAKTRRLITKLIQDEEGGEVLETALVLGFIVVAALGIMSKVGMKVFGNWVALRDML